eukprot:TRINITY_DN2044_c0_g1_i1.p1 TRINITY_DN2044_c0_g1~~TRINITY_DN2044_c0_g1_i1.p1  ORF type:complete len:133 (-),score=0.31 TRINITY_DN2044_c0_g1_i1:122-520(-)
MSHFVNWKPGAYFRIDNNRTITKLYNNDYRKVCSAEALTGLDSYHFKFTVLGQGTIAIGLVEERFKEGPWVDNRNVNTFKYVGFYNGNGGVLNYDRTEISKGCHLALRKGNTVELTFNQKDMTASLKTTLLT